MEIGKINNDFYYISSTVRVVIPVSDIVQKMYRDSKRQVHLLVKGTSGYFWVIFKYSDVKTPVFTNYLDFRQWFEDNLFEVPVGVAISDDAPDLPSPYPFWLDTSEDPEVLFINVNNDYWLEYAGGDSSTTYQTITIAVADWSGGTTCTKSVTGVTATTWNVFAFAESYREKIIEFDVRPSGQGAGTITFTADSTPDAEIVFIVQIKPV